MPANFSCNLTVPAAALPRCWKHIIGSDHALIALRRDWQTQLQKTHDDKPYRHYLENNYFLIA